eukprot:CAMPEP_0185027612 /NCGR_PEP_ID=MMETSP1103-20130426/12878_1 /TAXON_ID=36769 /ORGANISM="Paraphysomonas bandaiensis, Strain Caron Lab Isolate" /LENGTH=71 /DNA_ID=CAMNT_0027561705 /DNA_START=698 /DNA_END=913 /DNA_ORIENTATION=+
MTVPAEEWNPWSIDQRWPGDLAMGCCRFYSESYSDVENSPETQRGGTVLAKDNGSYQANLEQLVHLPLDVR